MAFYGSYIAKTCGKTLKYCSSPTYYLEGKSYSYKELRSVLVRRLYQTHHLPRESTLIFSKVCKLVKMKEKVCHHLYTDCSITLSLYKDLTNAKELRQNVMNGEFEATLLKTSMITDPFQVLVAANRALHLHKIDKMTTKNVHSEVLFCLSSTKNISDSFRKFGLGDGDTSVFVVVLNDKEDSTTDLIQSKIQGTQIPLTEVKLFTDEKLVKKLYKVTDTELNVGSLTDALVSKIASKEFVTI